MDMVVCINFKPNAAKKVFQLQGVWQARKKFCSPAAGSQNQNMTKKSIILKATGNSGVYEHVI